jgi:hypothetical protein
MQNGLADVCNCAAVINFNQHRNLFIGLAITAKALRFLIVSIRNCKPVA